MSEGTVASRWNLDAIEDAHRRWKQDPASVDESWRYFFEGFELGAVRPARRRRGRRPPANRRHPPHLRLPRPRPFPRPSRPPQRAAAELSAAGAVRVRPVRGRPGPRLRHQPVHRPAARTPARPARRPARDLLPHHRRRVHAHPGHAHPPLAAGAHGAAPQSAQLRPRPEDCASSRACTTPSCSSASCRPATPARSASRWKAPRR